MTLGDAAKKLQHKLSDLDNGYEVCGTIVSVLITDVFLDSRNGFLRKVHILVFHQITQVAGVNGESLVVWRLKHNATHVRVACTPQYPSREAELFESFH